ncbi:hypothetical protein HPB49_006973 [Dermacentor silvarum]|uniref:Uncharacterized protein n=1 Tax=Dermacentor silvarum TaxID=543639 RepID=A0ACB8DX51_DERSI|nr:hypothetical protein HPB49_006973 [Dermacentor silvarum]
MALQLKRLLFHERQRMVHSHTQRCVCRLLLLGQADQAVQLLLETEAASEHFYSDSLRACLVASLKTESKAQSVVKLVATNLIANGRTWDGVQLLCLIGKGLDACRYLQAAGPGQGEGARAVQKGEDVASLDTKPGVCLGHQSSAHWKDPLPGGRVSSPGRTGQGSTMVQPATLEVRRTGAARNARGVAAILAQQPPQKSLGSPDCTLAGTAGRDDRQPGQQQKPE